MKRIAAAKRVTNPGCWSTGFLALVRPLVARRTDPAGFPAQVNGVSGYSGGGKAMIEEFEKQDSPDYVETVVRTYALDARAQACAGDDGARRPDPSAALRAQRRTLSIAA